MYSSIPAPKVKSIYLKIALRALSRQKGYALVNVGGLAVGTASALIILLYVLHERSYDRFHPNTERIFQIVVIDREGESSRPGSR